MSGTVTADRRVLSHLQPVNLQVIFTDAEPLLHYRVLVGLLDLDGAAVYDINRATMGDMRIINGNGAIVFPRVMADVRGGLMTLSATLMGETAPGELILLRHVCRYGRVTNGHLLFEAHLTRSTDSVTDNSGSDKGTVGGKVGANYGIASGEVSGSYERQGPTSARSSSYSGGIRDITVVWIAK